MASLLAWCADTEYFAYHPALHMPVGLATIQQQRERVTRVYAMIDAGGGSHGVRKSLTSYPIALRLAGGNIHFEDDYDEMPPHTERGHLIADVFGGADDERNLVPMPRQFNQQTWKNQVEAAVAAAADLRKGELLGLSIRCSYTPGTDPRIPTGYAVDLYTFGPKNQLRLVAGYEKVLAHPNAVFGDIPQGWQPGIRQLFNPFNYKAIGSTLMLRPMLVSPLLDDSDESVVGTLTYAALRELAADLQDPIEKAYAKMQTTGWCLENTTEALYYGFELPPPHRRPYAVLDYMLDIGELQRLHPKLENKTLGKCFSAKGFADWKRELIFAANMVRHGCDWALVSDNEDDEVYREVVEDFSPGTPGPSTTMGRYEYAVREWAHAVGLKPGQKVPRGALFLNSTAYAPQVDHVVAKAGKGTGIDAFSNAQVVSGRWNRSKSDNVIEQGAIKRQRMLWSRND